MTPFTVQQVERTITFHEDDEDHDDEHDAGPVEPTSLRGALDALESDCWDNLDVRADTIIGYPADSHQDMYSGAWISTQVIVKGDPRNVDRLLALYEARKA